MKSKEFIETKLLDLYKQFNDIKIRYEFRPNTFSHLIEILPISIFKGDKNYITIEAEIEEEFEVQFPDENIIFISEDSLTEIINPLLKLGYNEIKFDIEVSKNIDFIVEGFNDAICNNYSLAA